MMGVITIFVIGAAYFGAGYYRSSVQKEVKPSAPAPPTANSASLVREDSPTLGPADAKVTLVEFYDPECESCASFAPIVKKILKDYDGKIRLVARYMPLHPNSMPAASFIEAAREQGKYWEAQELLFAKQPEWGEKHGAPIDAPKPNINALFDKYAKELGLDLAKAGPAIAANRYVPIIERDKKDGQALGVRRTPTFFVNGRKVEGNLAWEKWDEMLSTATQ